MPDTLPFPNAVERSVFLCTIAAIVLRHHGHNGSPKHSEQKSGGMIDEIDVAIQKIVARHRLRIVGCARRSLRRHCRLAARLAGNGEMRLSVPLPWVMPRTESSAPSLKNRRSSACVSLPPPPPVGGLINCQNLPAVIREAGSKELGRTVNERVRDHDDRAVILLPSGLADLGVRIWKRGREGGAGFHRSLSGFDPKAAGR